MASHNELGKLGESLACKYMQDKGFTVLHTNWVHAPYEIDMIASKGRKLHFIEVKTRRSTAFGFPEESVDKKKFKGLQKAAAQFQYRNPQWKEVQFDILSIMIGNNNTAEYFYIEDVYLT